MAANNRVVVDFDGNSMGLLQALGQVQGGLQQFQAQVGQTGGATTAQMDAVGNSFAGFSQVGRQAIDIVTGPLDPFIDKLGQVAQRAGMVLETMTLWRGFDFVTAQIQSWTSALFELNNTMERTQTAWLYLFGTGNNAKSITNAQQMAEWTKKESYNLPFTRQDMLTAMTSLATTNPNAAIVEKYLPLIADFASTRTNFAGQPLTLGQAAYSLVGAQEGYTRMLKYDLKIDPNDLVKLGWDRKDPTTLFPALQKYADEHHITGAAKHIATSTWFGEKSSFEDRIQNFQLDAGQGLFKGMEADLNAFTGWWDSHQGQLDAFAKMIGTNIAGALHAATDAAKGFFSGWSAGPGAKLGLSGNAGRAAHGLADDLGGLVRGAVSGGAGFLDIFKKPLQEMADLLSNPAVKEGFATVGHFLGELGKVRIGFSVDVLTGFFEGIAKSGVGQALERFVKALDQMLQKSGPLSSFGGTLAQIAGATIGAGLGLVVDGLTGIANLLTLMESHEATLEILKVGLAAIAVVIAGELVSAVIALTVNLTAAAIAEFAVMWPVYLLIAIIAALVVIVIEIVQHWHDLGDALGHLGEKIGEFLGGAGRRIGDFFSGLGTWAHDGIQRLRTGIVTEALNLQHAWQTNIIDPITHAWDTLVKVATHWGEDLMHNLVQGIDNGIQWVKDAVGRVGDQIKGVLGHSVPREGPLADELTWMPHMMTNLASGITAGIPLVSAASLQAAHAIGVPLSNARLAAGHITHSSVTYGSRSAIINIHASDYGYIQRIAQEVLAMRDQHDSLSANAPGGFRSFGSLGV